VKPLFALLVVLFASATGSAFAEAPFIPLLQPGDAIPPIPLVTSEGRAFSLAQLHGKAIAVSFIYTRCGDARMCPLVSAKFARAQRALGAAPIELVLLTLDPAFDTPAVLARYGRAFGQDPRRWTLATGAPGSLTELAGRFGIATQVTRPGSLIHTEALAIVAPGGRLAQTIYGNDWTANELLDAARATLPGGADSLGGLRGWLAGIVERCGAGGLALSGTAMLAVLACAFAVVGAGFWFAFHRPAHR